MSKQRRRIGGTPAARDLPEEIISDILCRLPVKPLIRLKLVSKHWLALITDPDFIQFYLNRTTSLNVSFLVYTLNAKPRVINFFRIDNSTQTPVNLRHYVPKICRQANVKLVGSVNGIVCLSQYANNTYPPHTIILWNPATNHLKKVAAPKPLVKHPFHNNANNISVGFGYDPEARDYKIVRIVGCRKRVVEVYSSNMDVWTKISCNLFSGLKFEGVCSVIVKGMPYWVLDGKKADGSIYFSIVKFDVPNHKFCKFQCPEYFTKESNRFRVLNWMDSFAVMVYSRGAKSCNRVALCTSDDGGSRWTKKYMVPIFDNLYSMSLCFSKGEIVGHDAREKLFLFDPNTDEFKSLVVKKLSDVMSYAESMVYIQGMERVGPEDDREDKDKVDHYY